MQRPRYTRPPVSAYNAYNTSKAAIEVLVGSLLGDTNLNYVAHKGFVCRASANRWKQREIAEKEVILIRKELEDRVGLNCLRQATYNGAYLTAIPHRLNGMGFSWEEFQDNLLLWYGIVPLNIPTDCDGCGKKFSVPHALSCPKGGLVMAWHNDAAKEWGALSPQAINPIDISYKPKINSRTLQG